MKRRVAIIGAVTGTIVETAAHRRVAAKAEFGQHRRAVGTEAIAPGAIDRRGNAEPVADRIQQRGPLRALQVGRPVPELAVARVPSLIMRRGKPGVEVGTDFDTTPR